LDRVESARARIAVGGIQHETNTFAPLKATLADFEQADAWPGLTTGPALLEAVKGINLPAAGFIDEARSLGHELVPLLWCSAQPSAHVTRDAFEFIVQGLLARLAQARSLDAVYLDLHGAMVAEHIEDADGEVLARVRKLIGPGVLLVASLDFHANVSARMVEQADGLVSFRSYPHVDMADTGARTARLLDRMLRTGSRLASAWHGFEFLTGIPSQCSFIEPCRGIYRLLGELEQRHDAVLSFTPGFPMADFDECGMAVFGYGGEAREVAGAVEALRASIADSERDFALELYAPDDAVARAKQRGEPGAPVVLADTQDNPGAGGNGDTTGLLAALVQQRAHEATLGLLIDAQSAERAHQAGQGARLAFTLGGRSGIVGDGPFAGEFTVERLGDGRFTCSGPMFKGFRMNLGPMALLRSRAAPGVRVALATRKCQAADQEMLRHLGVEPRRERILALKSSVHFRADFEPIAREVLVVKAPGPALADPAEFRWTKLRKGVRLRPLGPVYQG